MLKAPGDDYVPARDCEIFTTLRDKRVMEDRQFMRLLAIVVATGLVLGLVTFRVTRGGDAATAGARGPSTAVAGSPSAVGDGTDSSAGDTPPDGGSIAPDGTSEPTTSATPPPPMQGPGNIDPPGTAVGSAPPAADPSAAVQ